MQKWEIKTQDLFSGSAIVSLSSHEASPLCQCPEQENARCTTRHRQCDFSRESEYSNDFKIIIREYLKIH